MALRYLTAVPYPELLKAGVDLPWHLPLEEWPEEYLIALPRGISRHVVRIVRLEDKVIAVKETREHMAFREYRMLRDLEKLNLPVVTPVGVVTGREDEDGNTIEAALVTVHLKFSLPYRTLFSHGVPSESLPKIIDALVVLLVRLHLAGFFWGDVSLSNVLFRRSAGAFAAYLVDAETGELHARLSDGQRAYDLDVAYGNLYGEMLDLQAGGLMDPDADPDDIVSLVRVRYETLWRELTGTDVYNSNEVWRIQQRIEHLNELGFDVEEVDISTEDEGRTLRVSPRVLEAGHHRRELQRMTGLDVEENQARRLLSDIGSFTAYHGLTHEDRSVVAYRWLTEVFQPVWTSIPVELRGKRDAAEVFHEILEHRWLMAEQAGHVIDTFDAARSYVDNVLRNRPDELVSGPDSARLAGEETMTDLAAIPAEAPPP